MEETDQIRNNMYKVISLLNYSMLPFKNQRLILICKL